MLYNDVEMRLREWEVWYTYSLYFTEPLPDLPVVAAELVASGLAEATLHSDGTARWSAEGGNVKAGILGMDLDPSLRRATINFPSGIEHPFAVETLYQCGYLRYGERVTLGETSAFTPAYFRTLLGHMELRSAERIVAMYPVVKLHASGVLLISFRMMTSGTPLSHRAFIDRFVHLPQQGFAEWWVPPALARIAPLLDNNALPASQFVRDAHDAAVEFYTEPGNPHLNLQLAPVGSDGSGWTLTDVAISLADTIRVIADRAITAPHRELRIGPHWSARPNIHLIRFVRQQPTVAENEAAFAHALGSILAGAIDPDAAVNRGFLPPNARPFSDYAVYTNSATRLWVHALRSLRAKRQLPQDPNRGVFVYEQQAIADAIDHAYALHHRFASAAGNADEIDRALDQQRELVALEAALHSTGRSGDIRDLIRRNLDELGVPALRAAAQQLLAIQQQRLAVRVERRTSAWATAMTFVFGLLAVPPIASEAIQPLWHLARWPVPADSRQAHLLFLSVAIGAVLGAIGAVRFAVDSGKRR